MLSNGFRSYRKLVLTCLLAAKFGAASVSGQAEPVTEWATKEALAAEFSVYSYGRSPYNRGAPFLTLEERREFSDGAEAFKRIWPVLYGTTSGIAAIQSHNGSSCEGCHVRDGRGRSHVASIDETGFSIVLRSVRAANQRVFRYPLSVDSDAQSLTAVEWRVVRSNLLSGGEEIELVEPFSTVDGYHRKIDLRNAPGVYGLGLLEAVPDEAILARATENAYAEFGVYGRVQRSTAVGETGRIGRFGWKATFATVHAQVRDAMVNELGLGNARGLQQSVPKAGEIDVLADLLISYVRRLAVPARRISSSVANQRGASLFQETGCAMCHTPSWVTGSGPDTPNYYRNQKIFPFTDFLLHDMGEALAVPNETTLSRFWRTPPLWGIGAQEGIIPGIGYLHDGRARNLTEAILWHGGEAAYAVGRFKALSKSQRQDLMTFLSSL